MIDFFVFPASRGPKNASATVSNAACFVASTRGGRIQSELKECTYAPRRVVGVCDDKDARGRANTSDRLPRDSNSRKLYVASHSE